MRCAAFVLSNLAFSLVQPAKSPLVPSGPQEFGVQLGSIRQAELSLLHGAAVLQDADELAPTLHAPALAMLLPCAKPLAKKP